MQDLQVKCKDCTSMFAITVGEQEFYKTRTSPDGQAMSLPKRCKDCRMKKKEKYAQKEVVANSPSGKVYNDMMDVKSDKDIL